MFKPVYLTLMIYNKALLVNHNLRSNATFMLWLCITNDSMSQNVVYLENVNINIIMIVRVCYGTI